MPALNRLIRISFLPWLVLMAAAVALLGLAATQTVMFPSLDNSVIEGLRAQSALVPLSGLALALSEIGSTSVALFVAASAVCLLAFLRHWHGVFMVVVSALSAQVVVQLIKHLVERPRPDAEDQLVHASGFSFPSGHSATAMAIYATITFLAVRALRRGHHRVAAAVAGGLLVGGIGLSRIFLGVHYPTDVLAGWITGAGLVLASWGLVRVLGIHVPKRRPAAAAAA